MHRAAVANASSPAASSLPPLSYGQAVDRASASLSPADFPSLNGTPLSRQPSYGASAFSDPAMRRAPGTTGALGSESKQPPGKGAAAAPSSAVGGASTPWLSNGVSSAQHLSSPAQAPLPNGASNASRNPAAGSAAALGLLDSRRPPALNGAATGAASRPLPPALPSGSGSVSGTSATGSASGLPAAAGGQAQTPAQQVLFSPADRFGLLGLLHIIKTSDPDVMALALGSDLSKLGLDLSRRDNLAPSLLTPWTDSDHAAQLNIEPEYHLPACYNVSPPPAHTKVAQFSDETLFYIFYTQPRDLLQEAAAQELYKHNWRYHKEVHLWLTKESGIEPSQKTDQYERGSYIFFDPVTWDKQKRQFVLVYNQLESRPAQSAAVIAAQQAALANAVP